MVGGGHGGRGCWRGPDPRGWRSPREGTGYAPALEEVQGLGSNLRVSLLLWCFLGIIANATPLQCPTPSPPTHSPPNLSECLISVLLPIGPVQSPQSSPGAFCDHGNALTPGFTRGILLRRERFLFVFLVIIFPPFFDGCAHAYPPPSLRTSSDPSADVVFPLDRRRRALASTFSHRGVPHRAPFGVACSIWWRGLNLGRGSIPPLVFWHGFFPSIYLSLSASLCVSLSVTLSLSRFLFFCLFIFLFYVGFDDRK